MLFIVVQIRALVLKISSAELSLNFCEGSCPELLSTIRGEVDTALAKEARMGASLLRVHFHDCFARGCYASILLDDTPSFTGEKTASPNFNSARGFDVIDDIEAKVERVCQGVVSCADILAVVARDFLVALGGPSWSVLLGRRDSTTTNKSAANSNIIGPLSNLTELIDGYSKQGFNPQELVALSGGHTIGLAQCKFFEPRYSRDKNIDPTYTKMLANTCSKGANVSHGLDAETSSVFDNKYFVMLTILRGLLHTDEQLFQGPTQQYVEAYAANETKLFEDFSVALSKFSVLGALTGSSGVIRSNCRSIPS